MKKFFFCISLVLAGLMASCVDKNAEVDADSKPSWLGESIYAELKNPSERNQLTGTFGYYLRLIDDLDYDEVLSTTGSKTIFPANDEAFERFFKSNDWGVSRYEQLSLAQKKLLLYSSMLDNALLLNMLPNVSNNTNEPVKGMALRHATNVSILDSVQFIPGSGSSVMRPEGMPANNGYWNKYYQDGIYVVCDATTPMMVHLTREFMLKRDIQTLGSGDDASDFEILTGTPYSEGTAYLFNDRVVKGDVTCQNGYIHQMENVVVPPGNMAQVLRRKDNTTIFSRILDFFAAPYYDETTTKRYHDWYREQEMAGRNMSGVANPDSIYQLRYLSLRSQGGDLQRDPNRQIISGTQLLSYDPGWNHYYPKPAKQDGNVDYEIMDMGAFFVPSDDAMRKYFLPGGSGAYLIDIYGDKPNTAENLLENIDSLHSKNPQVLTAFTNNLLRNSFAATVPSKFETITNDASENLGLRLDMVDRKDGKYDITIANNGAIYVLNQLIAPAEYLAVLAPASVYPDMRVMNWAIQDGVRNGDYLGVDFKYYLLAMSATFGLFIPDDTAFDLYYLDPASLGHLRNNEIGTQQADVLHFFYDTAAKTPPYLACNRHYYDLETGEIDSLARKVNITEVKSQLVDILNYHTLVLNDKEKIGDNGNHYYKTKHGGEIYVDGNLMNGRVMSGLQINQPERFPAAQITSIYDQANGMSYRLNRVIQPTIESVYSVLSANEQFSEFLQMCMGFGASQILEWAGISKEPKQKGLPSPQDAFTIFTRDYKLGATETTEACLDYNVKMFNTYNYTLFAPDNTAMGQAYNDGLPKWADVQDLFMKYAEMEGDHELSDEEENDKVMAYNMIKAMRDFVRFHFVSNSVYADNTVEGGRYHTLSTDDMGVAKEVGISGGGGTITVTDLKAGHSVSVDANSAKMTNKMTRDYWFNATKTKATEIKTSSFCAVHQISSPLYGEASGRFDGAWASRAAFSQARKVYRQKKANNNL